MKLSTRIVKPFVLATAFTMMTVPAMAENNNCMNDSVADELSWGGSFSAAVSVQNDDLLARGGNGGSRNGGGGNNGGGRNGDADGSADGSRPADGTGRGPGTGDCINA